MLTGEQLWRCGSSGRRTARRRTGQPHDAPLRQRLRRRTNPRTPEEQTRALRRCALSRHARRQACVRRGRRSYPSVTHGPARWALRGVRHFQRETAKALRRGRQVRDRPLRHVARRFRRVLVDPFALSHLAAQSARMCTWHSRECGVAVRVALAGEIHVACSHANGIPQAPRASQSTRFAGPSASKRPIAARVVVWRNQQARRASAACGV